MLSTITSRRTAKVIGDPGNPLSTNRDDDVRIGQILEAAGNAPFHYACDRIHQVENASPVPWRVYSLDASACRELMREMLANGDMTKIPNMLAAAAYLLQVTWLPDEGTYTREPSGKDETAFSGTLRNMEHIAAASAFTQSVILGAETEGYKTYWSSGGPLRGAEMFARLGIPHTQMLLGSVFLFPMELDGIEVRPGAMVDQRGSVETWRRRVEI